MGDSEISGWGTKRFQGGGLKDFRVGTQRFQGGGLRDFRVGDSVSTPSEMKKQNKNNNNKTAVRHATGVRRQTDRHERDQRHRKSSCPANSL